METQCSCDIFDQQLAVGEHPLETNSSALSSIRYAKTTCMTQTSTNNRNTRKDFSETCSAVMQIESLSENDQIKYGAQPEHKYSISHKIDVLLTMATACRTEDGNVDAVGMNSLLDTIEEIDNTNDALINFVGVALGNAKIDLIEAPKGGARGRSVSKVFSRSEELVRELSSLARLRSPEFTHFTIPAPLAAAKIKDANDTAVLVSKIDDGSSRDGRAFAQLHTRPDNSGDSLSNNYLSVQIDRARHLASVIAKTYVNYPDIIQLDMDEVLRQLEQVIEECRCDRSVSAIVHGDAHPGNLFWDFSKGVTFIDTPSLHYSMDSKGNPIGAPEDDVANFERRFVHYCRQASIEENEIESLRNAFEQEYHNCNGATLSKKKLKLFGLRYVFGDLIQACKRDCSKDIRAAIDSLKQVLG
ncbi:hypothetical protein I4U23_015916 [Adineta vaga]|nr:hypothetical protein I4U23_015916 [Adineta vaga]